MSEKMNIDLQNTLDLAYRMNWSVIPLDGNKTPFTSWKQAQKKPLSKDFFFTPYVSQKLEGLAVLGGSTSGVSILAFDSRDGSELFLAHLQEQGINPVYARSHKGFHFYFKFDERIPHTVRKDFAPFGEVDVRTRNAGYVALPGSKHPKGGFYQWVVSPEETEIPSLPEELMGRVMELEYLPIIGATPRPQKSTRSKIKAIASSLAPKTRKRIKTSYISLSPKKAYGLLRKVLGVVLSRRQIDQFMKLLRSETENCGQLLEGMRNNIEIKMGGLLVAFELAQEKVLYAMELFRYVMIPERRTIREEERTDQGICSWIQRRVKKGFWRGAKAKLHDKVNQIRRRRYVQALMEELEVLSDFHLPLYNTVEGNKEKNTDSYSLESSVEESSVENSSSSSLKEEEQEKRTGGINIEFWKNLLGETDTEEDSLRRTNPAPVKEKSVFGNLFQSAGNKIREAFSSYQNESNFCF